MVSSVVGVTAFLSMLLFAVQLVLNLYATSTVTAVAFDGARIVAGARGGPAAEADAELHIRSLLGGYDQSGALQLRWEYRDTDAVPGPDVVALTVEADHPTRLLRVMRVPYQHIVRTITVRMEAFR
ncbi:MAG: hypothetical protein QOI47_971 [Actinomycetota bacterium]|jgi:hypothetical protein|nr:hypothetical protein [Actinomycetota bacterium]